jgi:membrane-associated protein
MSADSSLIHELLRYGDYFLFPAVVIEGPIVTFIAGSLVAIGHFNFWFTYLVVIVADVTGDALYYGAGRFGRRGFQKKIGKWIGVTPEHLEKIEKRVKEHPTAFVLAGKFSHGIGGPILVASGLARMTPARFFTTTTLGTMVKSLILLGLGYYFGNSSLPFESYLRYFALASLVALLMLGWRYGKRFMAD